MDLFCGDSDMWISLVVLVIFMLIAYVDLVLLVRGSLVNSALGLPVGSAAGSRRSENI